MGYLVQIFFVFSTAAATWDINGQLDLEHEGHEGKYNYKLKLPSIEDSKEAGDNGLKTGNSKARHKGTHNKKSGRIHGTELKNGNLRDDMNDMWTKLNETMTKLNEGMGKLQQNIDTIVKKESAVQIFPNGTAIFHGNSYPAMCQNALNLTSGLVNSYVKIPALPMLPTHKVKDDMKIVLFTNNLLNHTSRLLRHTAEKAEEYSWSKLINHIAKEYEHKFSEFLRESRHQEIKTRLGTQKFILNSIDVSNRIVMRLFGYVMNEMQNKDQLRFSRTPNILNDRIEKGADWGYRHACSELYICRSRNSFTNYLTDVLTVLLSVDNVKFKQAFDSFTEAGKHVDLSKKFGPKIDKSVKKYIDDVEREDVQTQRARTMILKNIIAYRNMPLTLFHDSTPEQSKLRETLTFLEILDKMDEKIKADKHHIREWEAIKMQLHNWSRGEYVNIQDTMTKLVQQVKEAIDQLDKKALVNINKDGYYNYITQSVTAKRVTTYVNLE
ncbi:uncharacterized protein LOC142985542 [Anticarsia gemmatalis]|uniref:uncharacterized protein LOC142985542 n=1 Tax=Anticarsia gemmatalis TaxID=129554 RepID=UPI003F76CCDD